jgi:Zn-dependent protease with chaperone function
MPAYLSYLTVLGWSLLDSIWQMAILWVIYYLLTIDNKRISAAGKHNLTLVFVFIAMEWFAYTLLHLSIESEKPLAQGFIPGSIIANRWIPFLSVVYLGVIIFRFLQFFNQSIKWRKNRPWKILSPELQSFADRFGKIMGIPKRVQVFVSEFAETAHTSGFFKPFILLPASLITRLSPKQVEAILIHELFHVRRNDYVINICMSFYRGVFFFNPFAHLFYNALARERELACDDGVLDMGFAADQYAEALYCLEKFRQIQPDFSLAADGNKPWLLMERICRLLGKPVCRNNRYTPFIVCSLFAAFVLFGLQPKKSKKDEIAIGVTPVRVPVLSSDFESGYVYLNKSEKVDAVSPSSHRQNAKKQKTRFILSQANPDKGSLLEEPVSAIQNYFADKKTTNDFSNQMETVVTPAPNAVLPGTPYLPSMAFSYQDVPEIIWQDSIRNLTMQKGLNDLITSYRVNAVANLIALESEIEKNQKQLKDIEQKNKKFILLDQNKIKPLLEELHHQIMSKKQRIYDLKVRLENSEQEIIHI